MMNAATSLFRRLNIRELVTSTPAYNTASGNPTIIHRDIKAANILLDSNFEAKVVDFGLAKFLSDSNHHVSHVSTRVVGTFGRWATKKTAGSTKNGRDSKPKNLGVKKFGGERVIPGNIIVRQRGTRFHPGNYVGIGKDHTLYALKEGCVKFEHHKLSGRKWVHVEPKDGHVLHPVYSSTTATKPKTAS